MSFLSKLKKPRVAARHAPGMVLISLDGTPHSLLEKLCRQNRLPNLDALLHDTSNTATRPYTRIDSVLPCVSSVAWASYQTGLGPCGHDIQGFVDLQPDSYDYYIPTGANLTGTTIWETLGNAGKRVAAVNVPETYPPRPVNGVLVSGFLGTELSRMTHPPDFADRLQRMGYVVDVDAWLARENRTRMLDELDKALEKRFLLLDSLLDEGRYDYIHIHVMETDRLLHFFHEFYELGEKGDGADRAPLPDGEPEPAPAAEVPRETVAEYGNRFLTFYQRVDELVGRTVERLDEEQTTLALVSDHGFCTLEKEVYTNHWLEQEGWLTLDGEPKLTSITGDTRAFSLIPGRFYINDTSRYPRGSVTPDQYESVCDELTAALLEMRDPTTDRKIIRRVLKKEDIWQGPYLDKAPDLVADPHEGFDLKGNLGKPSMTAKEYLNGMHTFDDAFLYIGGQDMPGHNEGWIGDLYPTVLKLLGVELPEGLHSKPLV